MPVKPNDKKDFLLKLPAKSKPSKSPLQPMSPMKLPRKRRLGTVSDPEPTPMASTRAPMRPSEEALGKHAEKAVAQQRPPGFRTAERPQATRLSSSPHLRSRNRSSEYSFPTSPKTPMFAESPSLPSMTAHHKRHYHDLTPPEAESVPTGHQFHHRDHYFKTFGHETMYTKELSRPSPQETSQETPHATPNGGSEGTLRRSPQETSASVASSVPSHSSFRTNSYKSRHSPSDPISESSRHNYKRKRSSVFKSFRKAAASDSVLEAPRSGLEEPNKRRRSSFRESYFHVLHHPVAHATSSQSRYESATHGHQRAETPLSPGSAGTLSPSSVSRIGLAAWLRHQIRLEDIPDIDTDVLIERRDATPHSGAVSDRSENALDATPSPGAIPEIGTAKTRRRKLPGFRDIFRGLRNPFTGHREIASEDDTPEPATTYRRGGILPKPEKVSIKLSFASLIRKASRSQLKPLKGKSSDATFASIEEGPETSEEYTTEVTDFWQTPYSTRYNDAKKSETNAIRHMVDEALEDDEMMDVKLGFELNVPDHLPNSPLCPLDPRHKSGGKALCPLHGRKRRPFKLATLPTIDARATATSQPLLGTASKIAPQIVYEGKLDMVPAATSAITSKSGAETMATLKSVASEGSLQMPSARLLRQPTRKASVGWADQLGLSQIGRAKEGERRLSTQPLLSKVSEDGSYR
ncbi:hypothetical protein Tdes44962_MAKER06844 [Teratosphaeria destructans]|uniref:Uncharacterized protein n=1 Tax=Teratosphaeria destructans TaxID=418781 RepID=A0A9W7T0Z8_9PEZI|nr:hypothetical protein Tdes44962_MAKER06844 [Teratosphaeria destructans]